MAAEDEHSSQPDIAAMLTDQTSACSAARDAIAAGGNVVVWDDEVPQWMVCGIAATRLRRVSKTGQLTLGLGETVEILARRRGEQLRTGIIDAADRIWFFNLYFDATGTELLACSGVKRPSRPATKDLFER
ncbi:hypothetical protein [Streptomyces sp. AM8-1-1]|uniref:hypothetical protein n=1 Tax=Streptomyces sp. AM8-1-1 TaxID=3075825 RepID=UPI0028C50A96|nr:hypothetical protein [Streptomyces sp. AM8-1-1]WNO76919.1 hypothetical protein RPQ07_37255 [Streptomyces sp. AM8-1-1]